MDTCTLSQRVECGGDFALTRNLYTWKDRVWLDVESEKAKVFKFL